jgi:N-acetylneuraminic acid mutarotase
MKGTLSKSLRALRTAARGTGVTAAALTLAACGHSSSSANSSSYTVGGTITGLTTGSVVLVYNDTSTVTVAAGATTWSFAGAFAANSSYAVGVLTQPAGELCEVTSGGSGSALTAAISDIAVQCSVYGQWTWEAGLDTVNGSGVYGTQMVVAAGDQPGARHDASSWTDSSGNFWLFGGAGYGTAATAGNLNDLWQYNPGTGQWTWFSGSSSTNASSVYGTEGTSAAGNVPGARYGASAWTDSSGNLWLFGGYGYDATGVTGRLNDLWRYTPGTGLWTWVGGSNAHDASGIYGSQGTAAAGNIPGARYSAAAWTDLSGNLWLFGGFGYDVAGAVGKLNDLWRYSPATGEWTWVTGASIDNAAGLYGTLAAPAAGNTPGARQAAASWVDPAGNLYLFGGYGYDGASQVGALNDLWQYSPTSGLWTWSNGSDTDNAAGVYGAQGTAAAGNGPGARQAASSWADSSGNLWLFGGFGDDAAAGESGDLNDLWRYSLSTGLWTFVSGGSADNGAGAYGTQGAVSASTGPGTREAANAWIDSAGHLWLFGGAGYASSGNGYLNDLWQFTPP